MKLFRPLIYAALAMAAAVAVAALSVAAVGPMLPEVQASTAAGDRLAGAIVAELAMATVTIFAALVVLVALAAAVGAAWRRLRTRDVEFDGGYLDAWGLPDRPPD